MAGFLQKKWVRVAGVFPAALFVLMAYWSVTFLLNTSILRPLNQVLAITDLISFLGYAFALGILFGSGVLSLLMARFMGGFYRVLYITGLVAVLASTFNFPMALIYNAEWDSTPKTIPDRAYFVGTWRDKLHTLQLHDDSTYTFTNSHGQIVWADFTPSEGTWRLEQSKLHLTGLHYHWPSPWRVVTSEGYYFIRYEIPGNPDAWSGNLGLMRESDWNER